MTDGRKKSITSVILENMGFNSSLIFSLDKDYSIDPNIILLWSKKCINLQFKNFTTFLWSTKYDLEIISFLTQIVRAEKQVVLSQGITDKLEIDNEKSGDTYEVRSYYK